MNRKVIKGKIEMTDKDLTWEILANLGTLYKNSKGWSKEVNIISWNGNPPKVDIREWDVNHEKMSKGITLTWEECRAFSNMIEDEEFTNLEAELKK